MSHAFVEVQQAAKRFPGANDGDDLTVFENVSFTLEKGEFVCIIGHSGCGKSTIMNALAGLDQFSDGAMIMEGKEIDGPSLERGVVFQNYSLLPWLSALQNVRFGVRARWKDWDDARVTQHSLSYLEMVGLKDVVDRKPAQLSGGMRQRVSIARAFATKPELLLLDEPFGALDALTRGVIQDELIKIWSKDRQTVFMITHDVDEAILLADRILLMTNGPEARIAEAVEIDLPRPRQRSEIVKHPHFYTIRNYLVDFLVSRSGALRTADLDRRGLHYPESVNPVERASTAADTPPATDGQPASAGTRSDTLVTFTPKETHHG
ncbi:nitrate/nitrite transport system ATP-binding protein [Franzmannia pantelleriensis]|uniref:Nitrate/nitrite transport system ATP-binding protein n=1 Tax=Franzmannia pantelleriensis TaxID=48727 RepID=A0A1G9GFS2_9GAMM|nr:ABC transporter ATP-binding protein [Halomonas pantelleriensis]SDK99471.1 nitrate/nitrite transport system ATP-binding protein [Halomonas pantelleriensis]